MRAVEIAVDGGQTGLRIGLVEAGIILESLSVDGFRYRRGADPAEDTALAVATACAELPGGPVIGRICLGLTSAPADREGRHNLARRLARELPAAEVWLAGDMITAHAGALRGASGIVITVGTGTICLGVNGDRVVRADGNGYLLGDDGSGFAIGRAGLRSALRAREGRGPKTELDEAASDRFGDVAGFPHALYSRPDMVARIASFAESVVDSARGGDEVSQTIVAGAVQDLVTTAASVMSATFPEAADGVAVSFSGRLFDVTDLILDPFLSGLTARCPQATPRAPSGSPLSGAAFLLGSGPGPYRDLIATALRGDAS